VLNGIRGKEVKMMMDVANVQRSRKAAVLLGSFESPVASAQTSANCHTRGGQQ